MISLLYFIRALMWLLRLYNNLFRYKLKALLLHLWCKIIWILILYGFRNKKQIKKPGGVPGLIYWKRSFCFSIFLSPLAIASSTHSFTNVGSLVTTSLPNIISWIFFQSFWFFFLNSPLVIVDKFLVRSPIKAEAQIYWILYLMKCLKVLTQ